MNRALAGLSAGQWAARAAVAVMPLAALLCLARADDAAPLWLVVVVATTSVYWAAVPESAVGAPVLAVVAVCWGVRTGGDVDPLVLPAAGALLVAHVAAVVASYGPATMHLDGAVVRLWVRRAELVFHPVPAVYLLAVWAEDGSPPAAVWLVGLGCTFAAIAVASITLSVHADLGEE